MTIEDHDNREQERHLGTQQCWMFANVFFYNLVVYASIVSSAMISASTLVKMLEDVKRMSRSWWQQMPPACFEDNASHLYKPCQIWTGWTPRLFFKVWSLCDLAVYQVNAEVICDLLHHFSSSCPEADTLPQFRTDAVNWFFRQSLCSLCRDRSQWYRCDALGCHRWAVHILAVKSSAVCSVRFLSPLLLSYGPYWCLSDPPHCVLPQRTSWPSKTFLHIHFRP